MKTLNKSGIGRSLQILTANLDKLNECWDVNRLSLLLNNSNQKCKKVIENFFFEDELSSNSESEIEGIHSGSNIGNSISDSKMHTINNKESTPQRSDFGSFNALKNSVMITQNLNKPSRNRIMSEAVPLNPNKDRTLSIFDILINSRRNSWMFPQEVQNNPSHNELNKEQNDSPNLTSSILENLITEYLINLPSSLDEFYKVMGEIYVSEILKIYPTFRSPVDLMRETLLGPNNSLNNAQNNAGILNALLSHFSQSKHPSSGNYFENGNNFNSRNDLSAHQNQSFTGPSQCLLNSKITPKRVITKIKPSNTHLVIIL